MIPPDSLDGHERYSEARMSEGFLATMSNLQTANRLWQAHIGIGTEVASR